MRGHIRKRSRNSWAIVIDMRCLDEVLHPELAENQDVGKMSAIDPEELRSARKFEPS